MGSDDRKIPVLPAVTTPSAVDLFAGVQNGENFRWLTSQILRSPVDVFNVRHYGATGNGVANDSVAVQAALDAGAGRTVFFPAGTYLGNFHSSENTQVIGEGATSILKSAILASTVGTPTLEVRGVNVSIKDIKIDGQQALQPADGYNDSWGGGINGQGRSYRCGIKADGTAFAISNLRVSGCEFVNTYGAGIASLDVDIVHVRDCVAHDCLFEHVYLGHDSGTLTEAIICGCVARNIGSGDPVVNANANLISDYRRVIFSNNQAYNFERNACKFQACNIVVCNDNVVDTDVITGTAGIQFAKECNRIVASGNSIFNCGAGISFNIEQDGYVADVIGNTIDSIKSPGDGIFAGNAAIIGNLNIIGNTITNFAQHGIHIASGGGNIAINDNVIWGDGGAGFSIFGGIRISVDYLSISNNLLGGKDGTNPVIELREAIAETYDFVKISDNAIIAASDADVGIFINGNVAVDGQIEHNYVRGKVSDGDSATLTFPLVDNRITGNILWGDAVARLPQRMTATRGWNPLNLLDGESASQTITVKGATVGDIVACGYDSIIVAGWQISGQVTAANTVTITITNHTGGAINLPNGTVRVHIWQH